MEKKILRSFSNAPRVCKILLLLSGYTGSFLLKVGKQMSVESKIFKIQKIFSPDWLQICGTFIIQHFFLSFLRLQ